MKFSYLDNKGYHLYTKIYYSNLAGVGSQIVAQTQKN